MTFSAKVLTDSTNPQGNRITTVELTYPRCIHSEFMTHRMFSRNSASSRAIPIKKMLDNVRNNPFIPIVWGSHKPGMQAGEALDLNTATTCEKVWLEARDVAVEHAEELSKAGLHKQIVNRLVEPWMWITVICTGNEGAYANFFHLRCHAAAEPHMQEIANLLFLAYRDSEPKLLKHGECHTPLLGFEGDKDLNPVDQLKVSVGRVARVSYLNHNGERDVQADIKLHDRLETSGHWSPFEHIAMCTSSEHLESSGGNLGHGWTQLRKCKLNEYQRVMPYLSTFNKQNL